MLGEVGKGMLKETMLGEGDKGVFKVEAEEGSNELTVDSCWVLRVIGKGEDITVSEAEDGLAEGCDVLDDVDSDLVEKTVDTTVEGTPPVVVQVCVDQRALDSSINNKAIKFTKWEHTQIYHYNYMYSTFWVGCPDRTLQ